MSLLALALIPKGFQTQSRILIRVREVAAVPALQHGATRQHSPVRIWMLTNAISNNFNFIDQVKRRLDLLRISFDFGSLG